MELKDHLTATIDPFTSFYLEKAKNPSQLTESLNYVNEAKRRITKQVESKNEKVSIEVKGEI